MKRVLLLIDSLYSGGAQRQIVGLAELLKAKGYEIKLADYWDHDFYDRYLTEKGINFEHRIAKGKFNIFKSVYSLIRDFRPDVVICYLEHASSIACLVKALHLTRPFKLIVSERNTTQQITREVRIRFNLYRFSADMIVPNSYSQARFIKEHYPELIKKTTVITNYLDTDRFTPAVVHSMYTSDIFRFIVVGRVVEQKNPINLLRAVALARNLRPEKRFTVDWYGMPYPQSYFEECTKTAKGLNIEDIVHFHPPTQDIIKEYQTSDAFILPSVYEGFPNVLCEAMSCGLPVLASNVCDNPIILDNGKTGILFDPHSVENMADSIIKILDKDSNQIRQMCIMSREAAIGKFASNKFISDYMSLIED